MALALVLIARSPPSLLIGWLISGSVSCTPTIVASWSASGATAR